MHGNGDYIRSFVRNTIFVSKNHANRHHCNHYIHNGLDPDDYGPVDFNQKREYVHFLGNAAWRVKNVKGAIRIAKKAKERLEVLGGHRLNFNMGFRFTLDPNVSFNGMVGRDVNQLTLLRPSISTHFPVRRYQ